MKARYLNPVTNPPPDGFPKKEWAHKKDNANGTSVSINLSLRGLVSEPLQRLSNSTDPDSEEGLGQGPQGFVSQLPSPGCRLWG